MPLAEMFGYVTELRSATQGRGMYTTEFDYYAVVEPAIAKAIVSGAIYR